MLRRSFVKQLTLLIGGFIANRALAHPISNLQQDALLRLRGQFSDLSGMQAIGRRIQKLSNNYGDINQATVWIASAGIHTTPADLGAKINRQIREDFADGATLIVDGWVLSRTEAYLCVLSTTL